MHDNGCYVKFKQRNPSDHHPLSFGGASGNLCSSVALITVIRCVKRSVGAGGADTESARGKLGKKNSPSRFPFRPPFSMTFPLRVVPSNSASTYSGSVLGARGNLGAGHGLFKVLRSDRNRNLRKFNYPHIHSRLCSLWITPPQPDAVESGPCRTSDRLRCHTGSCPSSGASRSACTSGWVGSR